MSFWMLVSTWYWFGWLTYFVTKIIASLYVCQSVCLCFSLPVWLSQWNVLACISRWQMSSLEHTRKYQTTKCYFRGVGCRGICLVSGIDNDIPSTSWEPVIILYWPKEKVFNGWAEIDWYFIWWLKTQLSWVLQGDNVKQLPLKAGGW